MISIVCPIYNEEKVLSENSVALERLSHQAEFIFVDGGSSDRSVEIVRQYGKVLSSKKGRAVQMNAGTLGAFSNVLLFLHADTLVSAGTLRSIETIVENGYAGGCLTQRIEKEGFVFRLIEAQGNMRAKIAKVFYGDQGIFVRKDVFQKIGGFPEVPIMEDVLFTKKLRNAGNTIVLSDKIFVSPRRWEKKGVIKTALIYSLIVLLFKLGYPLKKIKSLYEDLR